MCVLAQSCPTLCNIMGYNLPSFSVHGIFQARILELVAISFIRYLHNPGIEPASPVSPALAGRFLIASGTWEAHEHWSGILFPPPEDLSNPGI